MVDRIVQDPAIFHGKPVVKGTRIPVAVVFEYLADNPNIAELFTDYPRLTIDDLKACFAYAQSLVETSRREKAAAAEHDVHRSGSRRVPGMSPNLSSDVAGSEVAVTDSATLWERIRALEGQNLPTISGRAAFDITAVDDGSVQILIRSKGKSRIIYRSEFERAESLGLVTADVTPSDLRVAGIDEFNPTYIAAILRTVVRHAPPSRL